MSEKDTPPGFTYTVVPEGGKEPSAPASVIKAAEARPEHSDVLWLMKNNLVIVGEDEVPNEFEIREMRTYPGRIGDKYTRELDSKPGRQARELYLSIVMGSAVFYVLADARKKVLIQLKKIAPVHPGADRTPSVAGQVKLLRGDATGREMVDEFDGVDLRDPKSAIHMSGKPDTTPVIQWGVTKAK